MKYTECKRCGCNINRNAPYCSPCLDIRMWGSKEKAEKATKRNRKQMKKILGL